jgi:hypothetical protein
MEGVFVKISSRAQSRALKRIDHVLIKFRNDVEDAHLTDRDKKFVFLDLRWKAGKSRKIEDARQRISNEFVNRTTRNREALQYEASANGLSL